MHASYASTMHEESAVEIFTRENISRAINNARCVHYDYLNFPRVRTRTPATCEISRNMRDIIKI